MSEEMMNTKEVAHYLGIHEKQVYALIGQKNPHNEGDGQMGLPPEAHRSMDRIERPIRVGAGETKGQEDSRRPARFGEQ